jgi:integrase
MDSTNPSKANLKKYTKVDGKWRFVPVQKVNGVPYPGTVLINGVPVRSTRGTFYLEFYEAGRRVQQPVGSSPREAKDAWYRHCTPEDQTMSESEEEIIGPEQTSVRAAFDRFLDETKATKEHATFVAYRADLNWVLQRIGKQLVGQITRHDILRAMGNGRNEGLDTKTVNRKLIVALMALRNAGATIEMRRGDWPKSTEPMVEKYDVGELKSFLKACTAHEKLLFQTFLCSGFRAREVATLTWSDVDFEQRTLRVRPRPEYRFKPKNHEERTVPVPLSLIRSLVRLLESRNESQQYGALVFPTAPHPKRPQYGGDKPDAHHLELCKQIAWRARLNCRRCTTRKGRCADGPYCEHWTLHKWRHTFATNALQSAVDIKSLQVLLGHKNLATTEKYLLFLSPAGLRPTIEKSIVAKILREK